MSTATASLAATRRPARLPAYGLFGAFLASAGLPLYIHAPKFYVDEFGVSLAALGTVLFSLRLLDVIQDPALGWLAQRSEARRRSSVAIAGAILVAGMLGLFLVSPPVPPLLWFALMLTLVFSAFSYLTICFYAEGVRRSMDGTGYLRLARWRETGALLGICAASVAPLALGGYAGFSVGFALLGLFAVAAMRPEWRGASAPGRGLASGVRTVLQDVIARRLLLIALVNAAPVAVSSTLFLFYVESRLDAPGWEGPLLLLFFLSAAASAPLWGRLAERHGPKNVLIFAMLVAIPGFGGAVFLGPGDAWLFALISIASGAAIGADMTLLPALFARRMEDISPGAAQAFGLWSFVSKFTLALAAVTLLPLLGASGFRTGGPNDAQALMTLALLYGALPCLLKLLAVALLARTPIAERS